MDAVTRTAIDVQLRSIVEALEDSPVAVNTKFMPSGPPCDPPVELKQFEEFTWATS